jgi:hypothetical protein
LSIVKRRIAYIYPYTKSNIDVVSKVNPRYDIAPADDYVIGQVKQYLDDRVDENEYIVVLADFLWRRGAHGAFGDFPSSSVSYVADENGIVEFELGHSDVPILYLNIDASDIQTIIHENHHMIERFGLTNDKGKVPQWKWTVNENFHDYNDKMRVLFNEIRARIAEMKTIYHGKGRFGRREANLDISMYANELYKFLYGYLRGNSYNNFSSMDSVGELCNLVFEFLENYMNGEFSLSGEEKVWIVGKLEKAKEKGFPKGARWDVVDIEPDMSYLDWHGKRKK